MARDLTHEANLELDEKQRRAQISAVVGIGAHRLEVNSVYGEKILADLRTITANFDKNSAKRMQQLIDSKQEFKNSDSLNMYLSKSMAQTVMHLIWLESDYIDDEVLAECGHKRYFRNSGKHLTRNALGNYICDVRTDRPASSESGAVKRSLGRICDALEVYGLVERNVKSPTCKPMHGTILLHQLMFRANAEVAKLYAPFLGSTAE